jgi:hypothetical protein
MTPETKPCETMVSPVNERRMRLCLRTPTTFVHGKWRCKLCETRMRKAKMSLARTA